MSHPVTKKLDAALKDPFTRTLCEQLSKWQDEFNEIEDYKEILEGKLEAAYDLASALVPADVGKGYGIELLQRYGELRDKGRLPR